MVKKGKRSGADAASMFGLTAAKYDGKAGMYKCPLADSLKLVGPAVYVLAGHDWTRCKLSRPTEVSVEGLKGEIEACIASHPVAKSQRLKHDEL